MGYRVITFAALIVAAGVALSAPVPSSAGVAELAANVVWIRGGFEPGRQPDGNTVIFRGKDGLLVMDTGRHPEHAQQILDYAAREQLPIVVVVNSHWHLDHISGNARLRAAYPELQVLASSAIDGALSGFLAQSRQQSIAYLAQPGDPAQQAEVRADLATIDSGPALLPDVRIDSAGARVLAGRPLQVGFERDTVTAGDVWLYDPETRVLAAGDLVTLPAPFFDTACPAHWQSALAKLGDVDFDILVPGHGGPMSRADFAVYRRAFDRLLACAASPASNAECIDGWQDAAAVFLVTDWDKKLAHALVDDYLTTALRGDADKRAALCGAAQ